MNAAEIAQRLEGIADKLEGALETDADRQYAAEDCLHSLRQLEVDLRGLGVRSL